MVPDTQREREHAPAILQTKQQQYYACESHQHKHQQRHLAFFATKQNHFYACLVALQLKTMGLSMVAEKHAWRQTEWEVSFTDVRHMERRWFLNESCTLHALRMRKTPGKRAENTNDITSQQDQLTFLATFPSKCRHSASGYTHSCQGESKSTQMAIKACFPAKPQVLQRKASSFFLAGALPFRNPNLSRIRSFLVLPGLICSQLGTSTHLLLSQKKPNFSLRKSNRNEKLTALCLYSFLNGWIQITEATSPGDTLRFPGQLCLQESQDECCPSPKAGP